MVESAQLLGDLSRHLQSELGVHRRLLGIAEHKRDTIVAGDIQAFSELLSQEQGILEEGQKLRNLREQLMASIADDLKVELSALHISHILERAPDPLRSELKGLQGDLRQLLEELRKINERNMVLIRQSLSFVKEIMQYVMGNNEAKTYTQQGESDEGQGGGRLLNAKC